MVVKEVRGGQVNYILETEADEESGRQTPAVGESELRHVNRKTAVTNISRKNGTAFPAPYSFPTSADVTCPIPPSSA